jgi:hypothetical protein
MFYTVPTREGQHGQKLLGLQLDKGRNLSLMNLSDRITNVSLTLLPITSIKDAYMTGQIFSVFGCATVILPINDIKENVSAFLKDYITSSAYQVVQKGTGWLQLGYSGMTIEEAQYLLRKILSDMCKKEK